MKIAAIIAEYNPFHNGHKYHIEQTRKLTGATHIAVIMSGNFVQRGDVAIFNKYLRAKTALEGGADLVIELPVSYSLASAESFARGAVKLCNMTGATILSFGSECADISFLEEAAGAVIYAVESDIFLNACRAGHPYPEALSRAIEKYYDDEICELLSSRKNPNDILGIEYIKAIDSFSPSMTPFCVKRLGASHNEDFLAGKIQSASTLRKMIYKGEDIKDYVISSPEGEAASLLRLETAILAKLRSLSTQEFKKTPCVTGGLENRIYKAVRVSRSISDIILMARTRRHPAYKIRRIIISAFLGITKQDEKNPPAFAKILGMNSKGKEIIAALPEEKAALFGTSLSKLCSISKEAKRQGTLEAFSGDMYALAFKEIEICGKEYTAKPIIY